MCGYLIAGILPANIAFPTLAMMLLGPGTNVFTDMLNEAFLDFISNTEKQTFKFALGIDKQSSFSNSLTSELISVLNRYGCRTLPTRQNLERLIIEVANFEFCVKPLAAILLVHCGIPPEHKCFWSNKSVTDLFRIVVALVATPHKVLHSLQAVLTSSTQERVFGYLCQMIGDMPQRQLRSFLRFATGCSLCLHDTLQIEFNGLAGLARRPIAHTCNFMLELSVHVTYNNDADFVNEFDAILDSELCNMHNGQSLN